MASGRAEVKSAARALPVHPYNGAARTHDAPLLLPARILRIKTRHYYRHLPLPTSLLFSYLDLSIYEDATYSCRHLAWARKDLSTGWSLMRKSTLKMP